jgi:hypothetical protein
LVELKHCNNKRFLSLLLNNFGGNVATPFTGHNSQQNGDTQHMLFGASPPRRPAREVQNNA